MNNTVKIAIVMGSVSDWEQVQHCAILLDELKIPYTKAVISAHRMPNEMFNFAQTAKDKGIEVIIAAAGGAAHLPGMIAAKTTLPVIGIPIQSIALSGLDSLLSMVQMPGGVPVATMAIGVAGAKNAALMAARQLAVHDPIVHQSLVDFYHHQHQQALASSEQFND